MIQYWLLIGRSSRSEDESTVGNIPSEVIKESEVNRLQIVCLQAVYPYRDIGGKTDMRGVPYGIGTPKNIRIGKSAQLLLSV